VLSDAPRSGCPKKFTCQQVAESLAVACEPPEKSNRPIGSWSHRELADEVTARGIVKSISKSHVGNLLRQMDLQPHKSRYWLNTKEKDPAVFARQVELVCQTYLQAPELYYCENIRTVSVDEMCGIQALERIAPSLAMRPGQPERIEFEYKRHGTLGLIGNWDVVLGQMIAPPWQKRPQRNSQVRDNTTRISIRLKPPSQFRLYAQAFFMAQSNRNPVWNHHSTGNQAGQL